MILINASLHAKTMIERTFHRGLTAGLWDPHNWRSTAAPNFCEQHWTTLLWKLFYKSFPSYKSHF